MDPCTWLALKRLSLLVLVALLGPKVEVCVKLPGNFSLVKDLLLHLVSATDINARRQSWEMSWPWKSRPLKESVVHC